MLLLPGPGCSGSEPGLAGWMAWSGRPGEASAESEAHEINHWCGRAAGCDGSRLASETHRSGSFLLRKQLCFPSSVAELSIIPHIPTPGTPLAHSLFDHSLQNQLFTPARALLPPLGWLPVLGALSSSLGKGMKDFQWGSGSVNCSMNCFTLTGLVLASQPSGKLSSGMEIS